MPFLVSEIDALLLLRNATPIFGGRHRRCCGALPSKSKVWAGRGGWSLASDARMRQGKSIMFCECHGYLNTPPVINVL